MNAIRLEGALLNFWVAKAAGLQLSPVDPPAGAKYEPGSNEWHPSTFHPSTDWTHAARFLMSEWYGLEDWLENWFGPEWSQVPVFKNDPLPWFMRAYVATQFGETLENVDLA